MGLLTKHCRHNKAGPLELFPRYGQAAVRIVVVFAGLCVIENLCQA